MDVEDFIAKWAPAGGNERANTQLFLTDLCQLLGVEAPRPTLSDTAQNDYVFERHVIKTEIDGATSNGWIDCYKRGSFILEPAPKDVEQYQHVVIHAVLREME